MELISAKHILVCPLEWGLGHATRCIPVIEVLVEMGHKITVAANGEPLELLKQAFPTIQFVAMPGYNIRYPKKGNMALSMLLQAPGIIKAIVQEQNATEKLVAEKNIDLVISDNRYGCYSKQVPSVFITHQLFIKAPVGEKLLHKQVSKYCNNYTETWIPDWEGENDLSGDLSHKSELPGDYYFIGPLSRFEGVKEANKKYKVCGIVSGPDPQRALFEEMLLKQLQQLDEPAIVVTGQPSQKKKESMGNVVVHSHLPDDELHQAISQAEIVISRPGYSTIMDLAALQAKAAFVPTPGQTEQEYLARYHQNQGHAPYQKQIAFNLSELLAESVNYKGFVGFPANNLERMRERLSQLVDQ